MTRAIEIRPQAFADLDDAVAWYAGRRAGLEQEFLDEIDRAVEAIAEMPARFPIVHRDVRRALVRRFPYAVFFVVAEPSVVVIAILHQARDPDRWRSRR